jgi:hypothetical protein
MIPLSSRADSRRQFRTAEMVCDSQASRRGYRVPAQELHTQQRAQCMWLTSQISTTFSIVSQAVETGDLDVLRRASAYTENPSR